MILIYLKYKYSFKIINITGITRRSILNVLAGMVVSTAVYIASLPEKITLYDLERWKANPIQTAREMGLDEKVVATLNSTRLEVLYSASTGDGRGP